MSGVGVMWVEGLLGGCVWGKGGHGVGFGVIVMCGGEARGLGVMTLGDK